MNKQEIQKLGMLINETQNLKEKIDTLGEVVQNLPCEEHTLAIKLIEQGRERNCAGRILNKKIRGNIKAQVIGGLIGAGVTGLIVWLTHLQGFW